MISSENGIPKTLKASDFETEYDLNSRYIYNSGISTGLANALLLANIQTLGELISHSEEEIRVRGNLGTHLMQELHTKLSRLGLRLADKR